MVQLFESSEAKIDAIKELRKQILERIENGDDQAVGK